MRRTSEPDVAHRELPDHDRHAHPSEDSRREENLALAFVVLLPASARPDEIPERLSAYMDAAAKEEKFSGSVLVAKDGEILLARGYGLANAEHEVPNTPETKFRLGSITKMFTATAILILQERGKLKVEDAVGKHLPRLPEGVGEGHDPPPLDPHLGHPELHGRPVICASR